GPVGRRGLCDDGPHARRRGRVAPARPGPSSPPAPAGGRAVTDDALDVALGYYLLAVEAGQQAVQVQAELLGRFPDRAGDLRNFFRSQEVLGDSLKPRTAVMPADPS